MKLRLIAFVATVVLAQSALAADPSPALPDTCPDMSAIAAVKFNFAGAQGRIQYLYDGFNWNTKLNGSDLDWSVAVYVEANTLDQAKIDFENGLKTAVNVGGPLNATYHGKPARICEYRAAPNIEFEAITPASSFIGMSESARKLRF